jgi:hypothetical protein
MSFEEAIGTSSLPSHPATDHTHELPRDSLRDIHRFVGSALDG